MDLDSPARGWPPRCPPSDADGEGLRPLEWAGLCARLLAARQLSRTMADMGWTPAAAGSFDPAAARGLVQGGDVSSRSGPRRPGIAGRHEE